MKTIFGPSSQKKSRHSVHYFKVIYFACTGCPIFDNFLA